MKQEKYDLIVVGSGATGGFAAKELTERGLKVLVLEAGPHLPEALFQKAGGGFAGIGSTERIKAAFAGQHKQAQATFYSPDKSFLFVNDRKNPYASPEDYFLWLRGNQVGGRFLAWGRVALRMSDYTFKANSREGTGVDWPISYADIAPYYEHVERFLGVVGNQDHIPYCPDGVNVKPAGLSRLEKDFKHKVEARWPDRKVMAWRYVRKEATPVDGQQQRTTSPLAAAAATGNLTLVANARVARVDTDARTGKATGVTWVDAQTKQQHQVQANVVMLCASTIESVRLLLNSGGAKHPEGLGNSTGQVGRYFMDQVLSLVFGTSPTSFGGEIVDGTSPADDHGGFYIPRFMNLDKVTQPGFKGGFNIQGLIGRPMVPQTMNSVFGISGHGEMLPRADNRVTLHGSRTDHLGIRIPEVRVRMRDNEVKLLQAQMRTQKELVREAGLTTDFAISALGIERDNVFMPNASWLERAMFRMAYKRSMAIGAAIHECGGARMGSDPRTSVLNDRNQVWDAPNVFVTDPSCFATNGTCGGTLTAMALTVRACEHIASDYGHSPELHA